MPTYAYRCKSCLHEFEELQSMSEPPLVTCPVCHKDTLVRMISGGAGLVFKGSGFYGTDYKSSSPKPSPETKHTVKDPQKDVKKESSTGATESPKTEKKPSESNPKDTGGGSKPD